MHGPPLTTQVASESDAGKVALVQRNDKYGKGWGASSARSTSNLTGIDRAVVRGAARNPTNAPGTSCA